MKKLCETDRPRLAVAALNPHASDGGIFGDEERAIIAPAVEQAKKTGINVVGPLPADIQTYIVFATGLSAAAAEPIGGKALIDFLRSDAATAVLKAKGW